MRVQTEAVTAWLQDNFSYRAFSYTLGAGLFAYLCLGLFLWLGADQAYQKRQEKLAAQTVTVEWHSRPVPRAPASDEGGSDQKIASPTDAAAPPAAEIYAEDTSPLTAAPITGLYEDSPHGNLPIIRNSDGLSPFQAYRRPFDFEAAAGKPLIAVAIVDTGLSDQATQAAIRDLPANTSLILSPYSDSIDFWARNARQNGHEIWLSLPMEPRDYPATDLGPHTLMTGSSESENLERLDWILSRTTGYAGLVGSPDTAFMNAHNDVRPVVNYIYRRGLGFIDSVTAPGPVAYSAAQGVNAPYAFVNLWLDQNAYDTALNDRLKQLEDIATRTGKAIGIIRPFPASYEAMRVWANGLAQRGFVLAPLSAVADPAQE